jgi:hypothetical protein
MEKYGTYEVYKNKITGELLRIPTGVSAPPEFEKQAGAGEWEKLDYDPEVKQNEYL